MEDSGGGSCPDYDNLPTSTISAMHPAVFLFKIQNIQILYSNIKAFIRKELAWKVELGQG